MSHRATARIVALLFLTSTVTFMVGSSVIDTAFAASVPDRSTLLTGVALEAYTGLAVAAIGWLMLPILRPRAPRLAVGYAALRLLECLAIVSVGASFLTTLEPWDDYDLLIYSVTGMAGLVLSLALFRTRVVPRWLAWLGLVGYPALLLGAALDAARLVDLGGAGGVAFFGVGGVFEVLLPVMLLVRGFTSESSTPAARPALTPSSLAQ